MRGFMAGRLGFLGQEESAAVSLRAAALAETKGSAKGPKKEEGCMGTVRSAWKSSVGSMEEARMESLLSMARSYESLTVAPADSTMASTASRPKEVRLEERFSRLGDGEARSFLRRTPMTLRQRQA